MRSYLDLSYTVQGDPAQKLDLYLPDGACRGVFVYFHGGGLVNGDKSFQNKAFPQYFTARGIGIVSANYRMYPHAAYPDFIEDAAAVVAWASTHLSDYGVTVEQKQIFVGGSSAGGYLSMMLCFDPKYLGAHGMDCTSMGGYVHDAGQPTCHFNVLKERGIDSRRVIVDESAPLYHIGTLPAYAPMLLIVSDKDMENRPQQTELVLSTLRHFRYDPEQVDVLRMHGTHCAYCSASDSDGDSKFAKMLYPFFEKHL